MVNFRTVLTGKSLLLLFLFLGMGTLNANSEYPQRGFQDGKYLVKHSVSYDKTINSSKIQVDFYNASGAIERSGSFTIDGVEIKTSYAYPLYNPYDRNRVDRIIWKLPVKKESKQRYCVLTTADIIVLKRWTTTIERQVATVGQVTGPTIFDDYEQKHISDLPIAHMAFGQNENDTYTLDGGYLFFNHDSYASKDPWSDGLTIKPSKKIVPTLFYYVPAADSYDQKWKLEVEETWILNYKTFHFGDYAILYTSYFLEGAKEEQDRCEAKLRLIDWRSGRVISQGVIQSDPDKEFMLSDVTLDTLDKRMYFTGDVLEQIKQRKWSSAESDLSYFVVGYCNSEGKVEVKKLELDIEPSEAIEPDLTVMPCIIVQDLRVLPNGQVFGGGLVCYWQTDEKRSGPGSVVNIPVMDMTGACFFKFDKDLNKIFSVYAEVPEEFDGEFEFRTASGNIRDVHSKELFERYHFLCAWDCDASAEVFVMLSPEPGVQDGSAKNVWAVRYNKGSIDVSRFIGKCGGASGLNAQAYPAALVLSKDMALLRDEVDMSDEFTTTNIK